jgi:transcriptional regulator with XRE-family HTH domain
MMTPGRLAKTIRVMHGFTQRDVAAAINCRENYLSHFETGRVTPSPSFLRKLADHLRIDAKLLQEPEDRAA